MSLQATVGKHAAQEVYLIRPRVGGLANDLVIQQEQGDVMYHVKAKLISPLNRKYLVYDRAMQECLAVEQDHTAIFPRFTMYRQDKALGKLGQAGVIPQNYFIHLEGRPRAELHLGAFDSIFNLRSGDDVVAEIAQHRSTWIVVLPNDSDCFMILSAIAVVYRLNTIGG